MDPLSVVCYLSFAVLYLGGNFLMGKAKSWTKARHHALFAVSWSPMLIPVLRSGSWDLEIVLFGIMTWLAIAITIIVTVQRMPFAKVEEDHDLRWDLRGKRK